MPLRLCILLFALIVPALVRAAPQDHREITWRKFVLDRQFRAEGVCLADINRDGQLDVVVGDVWYEGPADWKTLLAPRKPGEPEPAWKVHEIREPGKFGDPGVWFVYSKAFYSFADDINKDGWTDVIVIGFPSEPCHWYENPGEGVGREQKHWKEHLIWHSACNESPAFVDLFRNGKKVLVMSWLNVENYRDKYLAGQLKDMQSQLAWFAPGPDPTKLWEMHPISEVNGPGVFRDRFWHGLGIGDLNGDGRDDVITPTGWWEQPATVDKKPWPAHPGRISDDCAQMHVFDVDGDGKNDVLSSSAHFYGIWCQQQVAGENGETSFVTRSLFPDLISQTHSLQFKDINGDGLKDLITGKRWWAHGREGDVDPADPAVLFWFENEQLPNGSHRFSPRRIDYDSGIGTQFAVEDINGDALPDVIICNKKGTFVFIQERKSAG